MKRKLQYELFDEVSVDVDLKRDKIFIPRPSEESIHHYLEFWKADKYRIQEEILNRFFKDSMPTNTDLSEILIKTVLINEFYSTMVFDTFSLAKHIYSRKKLDSLIQEGSIKAIDEFMNVPLGKKGETKNLISFASKFCGFHSPKAFPLYDSYLCDVLRAFRNANNADNFANFTNQDLRGYQSYKNILIEFMSFYQLDKEEYSFKKLDMYLWQLGYDIKEKKKLFA